MFSDLLFYLIQKFELRGKKKIVYSFILTENLICKFTTVEEEVKLPKIIIFTLKLFS